MSFQIGYPRGDRFLSSVRLFSTRPLLIVVVSPVYVVGASVKILIGLPYYLEVLSDPKLGYIILCLLLFFFLFPSIVSTFLLLLHHFVF